MKKTIFITGSSSGLGKATAKHFAAQGWQVAATMRTPEKETELVTIENVKVFRMDVTDTSSVKTAVEEVISTFGKIDVVVNNAGLGIYGALELATEEDIDRMWNTNVRGVINVIRAVLPHFRTAKNGMFINVGSAMGLATVLPLISLYHTTKFALEGLIEGLYYELKPFNVDVRMIEPGAFVSEMNNNIRLNRRDDLKDYDGITDIIENVFKGYNNLPDMTTIEELLEVLDNLVTKKSTQFRTIVGKAAQGLIQARNAVSIESFLEGNMKNFS